VGDKIVSIRPMPAEADGMELDASNRAVNECLGQIAEQSPRLIALAWVVRGNVGSVAALRETDTDRMVIQPTAQESATNLAWAIHALPSALVDVFMAELAEIRARIEVARQGSNSSPDGQR